MLGDKKNHIFKKDAQFEDVFNLYKFDREFRLLIIRELEKIEIAVRTVLNNTIAIEDPFWFTKSDYFKDISKYAKTLIKINSEFKRSD